MKKKISKFLYWTPRLLSITFIFFLVLVSLDVFSSELSFWQTLGALLMHNLPAIILSIVLTISWKHEIVGGIGFILAGILYIAMILRNILASGFEWYYLLLVVQISGIAFFIGIMFLVGWFKKKKFSPAAGTIADVKD